MDRPVLSEKEAALIEAAGRELAGHASAPASAGRVAPDAAPSAPAATAPEVAARIAALIGAGQEERRQRRRKLRQFGIAIPAIIIAVAILWVARSILRYPGF